MNATDILKYGHRTVLRTLEDVPDNEWKTAGVCGVWSIKEIIAHLASFEHMLVDLLTSFVSRDPVATTYLDQYQKMGLAFNDHQVALRKDKTPGEALVEYRDTQAETMRLIAAIPLETLRRAGTLPWYGMEYDLEDFIVYTFYGHKREHMAQINVFKDTLKLTGRMNKKPAAH